MPRIAHTTATPDQCLGIDVDSIVRCGSVGAVWRVMVREQRDDGAVEFTLEPVDPHDVDLNEPARELPRPRSVAHA